MNRDDFVRRAALGGVIVATTVLSYSVLRERALHSGFPEWSSWLYPVGLDATILGASRAWQNLDFSKRTRRVAMFITLSAIASGVAGFVAEFSHDGVLSVLFASLIPAALAASLVLTSLAASDRRNAATEPDDTAGEYDDLFEEAVIDGKRVMVNNKPITIPADAFTKDGGAYLPTNITFFDEPTGGNGKTVKFGTPDVKNVKPPTVNLRKKPRARRDVNDASPEARRAWVRDRLDNGIATTGADVDKQFPGGARNGARIVRQVEQERQTV